MDWGSDDDEDLVPALHKAAEAGDLDRVQELIAQGDDVDIDDDAMGYTSLIWAGLGGNPACVAALIEGGADVNSRGSYNGETALHVACRGAHLQAVQLLLDNGADVHARDSSGNTPLMTAAGLRGGESCALATIEAGADVTVSNDFGSALHFAAMFGMLPVVQQMIKRGANADAANCEDMTPAEFSEHWWQEDPERNAYITEDKRKAIIHSLCNSPRELWRRRKQVVMLRARYCQGEDAAAMFSDPAPAPAEAELAQRINWIVVRPEHEIFRRVVGFL